MPVPRSFPCLAGSVDAQLFAVGLDADALAGRAETKAAGDAVFEEADVLVIELNDFLAVEAD